MEKRNKILNVLKNNKQYIQTNFKVNTIGLFGSYACNDFHSKSDIDILVTFSEPTFDPYMDLKFYLENIFGRSKSYFGLIPKGGSASELLKTY